MTETNLEKISFFKLLNLEAIAPENHSSTTFRNHLLVLPHHNADLKYKNNSTKTGYENFCIKKGTLKLFPLKDFDFIGKHVVCQKCCQKFVSKLSYRAHVGTDICVRTYNGPNHIYLKYKNKNRRYAWTANIRKPDEDFGHFITKNVLNPEMLNSLQTRNKVYSDKILQQKKVKEKPMNNSDKKNDGPFVKKSRGRPKKNIISNNAEVNLKNQAEPKKLNAVTVYSSSSKMSEKDEIKPCKLKKTDTKGSIPDEGKVNILCIFKNNENETVIETNNIDFDKNEKSIGIWTDNNNTIHPKITKELNNGCKSIIPSNEDNLKTVDKTPNITNSVKNHKNNFRLNCKYITELNCRKHRKTFKSIAEWKLHTNEHSDKFNETFLCTICGLKFNVYKNYKTHLNNHKKNKKTEQKCLKSLVCKKL